MMTTAKRKVGKSVPLRVTQEQFATLGRSRITCTLLLNDATAKYQPGMLAIVMEFDEQRGRLTQRQTLRIISGVWSAPPGYDECMVVIALQPVEVC